MKLDFDEHQTSLTISSYAAGEIVVGGQTLTQAFVLCGEELSFDGLPPSAAEFNLTHIERLLEFDQSMILLGVGAKQILLGDDVLRVALQANVGIEVMTTPAACRSYNVLVGENRSLIGVFYMP